MTVKKLTGAITMLFCVSVGAEPVCRDDFNATAAVSMPAELECEGLENPLSIEEASPRLSWKLQDDRRGARQTAYQIQVATTEDALLAARPNMWDSKKVMSDQSRNVVYAGKTPAARQRCCWRVRVWDQEGNPGDWSAPAFWERSPSPDNWRAKWIRAPATAPCDGPASQTWIRMAAIPGKGEKGGRPRTDEEHQQIDRAKQDALAGLKPLPIFRKEFMLPAGVRRARVYVCGLGFYDLFLNGFRVGNGLCEPVESYYPCRAFYNTYDITDRLHKGANCIGVLLGNGIYHASISQYEPAGGARVYGSEPGLILQIEAELDNGQTVVVGSDASWRVIAGPLVKDAVWVGEAWDARQEPAGWKKPGFNDSVWQKAIVTEPLSRHLSPQMVEPEHAIRRIHPKRLLHPAEGVWVFDMGELVSGVAELNVDVPAGACMALRYGEGVRGLWSGSAYERQINNLYYSDPAICNEKEGMLGSKKRGTTVTCSINNIMCQFAVNTDVYCARGGGPEIWHRRFGASAFRFVELTGYPGTPNLDTVTGVVIHADLKRTAQFSSSNPLLEQIRTACVDTLLYCLHHGAIYDNHSERQNNPCGIELRSCNPYAADMYNLWRKEIRDMIDWTAAADGIPPWYLRLRAFHYKGAEVPWGQYYVMAPWLTYLYYGDNDLLAEAYPLVKRYLEFWLEEDRYLKCDRPNDGDTAAYAASCDVNNGRIDWAETTNPELGSSGLMFDMLKTAARMARLFGKPDDASSFDAEAAVIAERLNRKYYDPVNKVYQCPKMYPPDYAWLKETERIGEGKIRPTQGGSALALTAGFAPEKDRTFIAAGIVRDMNENWNGHYSTGDMLSWRLPMALGDNGQPEAAYGILARKEYPGLGHCLSPGLNTICENLNTWNGPSGLDAFCQVNRLGLSNWLYEGLCGIRPDPEQPGFKHIILKPYVPPNLDSAGLHFASDYGEIVSAWQKQNGMLIYSITVPPNTTATVTIPAPSADAVTESGVRAEQSKGVSLIRTEAGSVVYAVQAGSYRFAVAFRVFPNLEGVPE